MRPYLEKYPTQNAAGRVDQVVKHLPSKQEAEFKSKYHKKKKKRKKAI
jgi:hypothetical protein